MSETTANNTDPAPLLSPAELAGKLRVNKQRVLAWYHEGKIPAAIAEVKIYRFIEADVRAALKRSAKMKSAKP